MLRKFTVIFLSLTLCFTSVACGGGKENANVPSPNASSVPVNTKLSDGQYEVQQATYDDGTGQYTLFLLNSTPPTFVSNKLQMARLTDDEVKQGKKSYLKVEREQPSLFLTPDFKIQYVHNVTEQKTNPQTGQKETVVVRQENGFWAPFAASLAGNVAGQALGSLFFRPQYYVPPAYQSGGIYGYGGYGSNYDQAVQSYRTRYNEPPAAVRNSTAFRSTGSIRNSYPGGSSAVRSSPNTNTGNRATGSGYGSSDLNSSGNSSSTRRSSGSSFGSGRSSSSRRSSGFGSRRR